MARGYGIKIGPNFLWAIIYCLQVQVHSNGGNVDLKPSDIKISAGGLVNHLMIFGAMTDNTVNTLAHHGSRIEFLYTRQKKSVFHSDLTPSQENTLSLSEIAQFDVENPMQNVNSTFTHYDLTADGNNMALPLENTMYPLLSSTSAVSETDYIDLESMNYTCGNDSIPCNLTRDQYFQLLYDYIYPEPAEWILIFSHAIVFVTGLVGNALVCIAVYTNYSMRTVTNIFIVNLAVADFFVILVCLPPSVVWTITETWFLGNMMCKIVVYFQSVSVTVSVLTLTFISIDRWYAICFPLRYRTKISRAIGSVAFIWIFALSSNVPEFLALQIQNKVSLRYETNLFTQCVTSWDADTERNLILTRFIFLYMLPLILMTIAYFKIVRVLWKSDTIPGHRESRNHQYSCGYLRGSGMPASNTSTMGQLQARRKAAKMLVAVVVMFAVCYFPVYLFNIMRYTNKLPVGQVTNILLLFAHWLCYANSAVNPVIYNFMSGKFRKEFRNALEKCRCARIRVEDRFLNHSNPASRLNNISPSTRSNYHLTSVRDLSRQATMQTTFVDLNCTNGHSPASAPVLNHKRKDQNL